MRDSFRLYLKGKIHWNRAQVTQDAEKRTKSLKIAKEAFQKLWNLYKEVETDMIHELPSSSWFLISCMISLGDYQEAVKVARDVTGLFS